MTKLNDLWSRLLLAKTVRFSSNRNVTGLGSVRVESLSEHKLIFHEQGRRLDQEISFYNTLCWKREEDGICLEHLRRGATHPQFLVKLLESEAEYSLQTQAPHLCGKDKYTARLTWNASGIHLEWTVSGPKKQETLSFFYLI